MLLNWIMLASALHKDSRRQRKDPLADPLDAPEWDGLRWAVPFLSWMAQRPHKADWLRGELAEARFGSGAAVRLGGGLFPLHGTPRPHRGGDEDA